MDPAEEIVALWLKQSGFFAMPSVDVCYKGKQIDFLAVDPRTRKAVQVEVHASVRPLGPFRAWGPAKYGNPPLEQRVRDYYHHKFVGATKPGAADPVNRCIEAKAAELLGTSKYRRWLVVGSLHPKDDAEQLKAELSKYGVEVFFLKDIVQQILRSKRPAKDPTGRFIQLLFSAQP